jgi:ABC-type Fe3+-siderophore transport system permease subunit
MHPLKHPRNAALAGIIFIVIGVIYWAVPTFFQAHVDYAGITMLAVLGISMAIMFYVLVAGSPNE